MSQAQLLQFVATVLEQLGVVWMLVGSHASSFFGEARSTHDIDLVIDLPLAKIDALLKAIPNDRYYLSKVALREGRMAYLIDTVSGDKVDLFLAGDQTITLRELSRRIRVNVLGCEAFIASAEDTIVAKLRWTKLLGGSERQVRDIRGIITMQRDHLDWGYIETIIRDEHLQNIWNEEIVGWMRGLA